VKVLVTGGAGFIGSHVVAAFRADGHEVAVVDDLSSGRRENVPPDVLLYEVDIRDADCLGRVFATVKPDVVDHHAAQIDVIRSLEDPGFDADVNLMGAIRLLECCRANGTRQVVFASSGGAIYGDVKESPTETHPPAPLSPYGVSKLCAEYYLDLYHRSYGLQCCALRYANVYGPRQAPLGEGGVVSVFLRHMLRGQSPTIFGDGEQTRDFVYAEDAARANLLAAGAGISGTFNIGTGRQTTVNALYAELARIAGFAGQPGRAPERPGEVRVSSLDASLAHRVLGWEPTTRLEQGLAKTTAYFREKRAAK
jgi:UDP-glucose 4-epimerase